MVSDEEKLESVQLETDRIVTGAMRGTSNVTLYEETGWHTFAKERKTSKLTLMYKLVYKLVPDRLCSIIPFVPTTNIVTYNSHLQFDLPHYRARTELYDKSCSRQQLYTVG